MLRVTVPSTFPQHTGSQDQSVRGMPSKMINRKHQPGPVLRKYVQSAVVLVVNRMYRTTRDTPLFEVLETQLHAAKLTLGGKSFVDPAKCN
jgi:hypothetical protein